MIASERAETKENRNAKNRSKRSQRWIEGLELHPVEAIEIENGDGVGKGCWAKELGTTGKPSAIDSKKGRSFPPCIGVGSFDTWFFILPAKMSGL